MNQIFSPDNHPGSAIATTTAPEQMPGRHARRCLVALALAQPIVGGGGYCGWHWSPGGRFSETAEDVYLRTEKMTVAPRVAPDRTAALVEAY